MYMYPFIKIQHTYSTLYNLFLFCSPSFMDSRVYR